MPYLFPSGKRPRTNQRRTKELPKNSETQKSTFIKIAHSFTSLIPSLILPTDDRENSERTPKEHQTEKVHFIKIAIYVFGHEWRFFCVCTCKNEKNVVTLHREPALGMSAHQRRRVADIIKGVYWRLFWSIENWKLSHTRNKKAISVPWCV